MLVSLADRFLYSCLVPSGYGTRSDQPANIECLEEVNVLADWAGHAFPEQIYTIGQVLIVIHSTFLAY